jgi:homoserine trans-succinylase
MPYPPNVSRRDKIRAGIIEPHSHECNFVATEKNITYEDNAFYVLFHCDYREGEWGEEYSCDEKIHVRYEISHMYFPEESRANGVEFNQDTKKGCEITHPIARWVVNAYLQDEHSDINVRPDRHDGHVEITYDGIVLRFEPVE